MSEVMNEVLKRTLTATFLITLGVALWIFCPPWVITVALIAILAYILVVEWPQFKLWWLTPLYPIAPFFLLIVLNQSSSRIWLPLLILITSSHDTGAYFVGRRW